MDTVPGETKTLRILEVEGQFMGPFLLSFGKFWEGCAIWLNSFVAARDLDLSLDKEVLAARKEALLAELQARKMEARARSVKAEVVIHNSGHQLRVGVGEGSKSSQRRRRPNDPLQDQKRRQTEPFNPVLDPNKLKEQQSATGG
jgi:hypothetical protein